MIIPIGQPVRVGWNASKRFDVEGEYEGRVEAAGYDWIVVRDSEGKARTAAFRTHEELEQFVTNMGD